MAEGTVKKWADEAMFTSEAHDATQGPKVHLLAMNADPLGQIAACAKMYKGEVVRSLSDVTHEERVNYLREMQKTKLKMPLEAVTFHFMLENVTRGFTHQLVRQRTAAYAQESMRFAVVEDMTQAVALPPSLARFNDPDRAQEALRNYRNGSTTCSDEERRYAHWVNAVNAVSTEYNYLVDSGMPNEDARGLMPTNIITRVNYITNLRGLLDHAGNRLCTQAQFEWRLVFAGIANAIRNYQPHLAGMISSGADMDESSHHFVKWLDAGDAWQYEAIAALLKPVCYQIGRCAFEADFDRKCSIRDRVQANADINRPSSEWDKMEPGHPRDIGDGRQVIAGAVLPIRPEEWLMNPGAAR